MLWKSGRNESTTSTDAAVRSYPQTPIVIDMADTEPTAHPLPMPVSSPSSSGSKRRRSKKSARIEPEPRPTLRVHWARFKRHLGTGTAPSSSSVIGGDESTAGESTYYRNRSGAGPDDEKGEVDEVVVDREWIHDLKSSIISPSELPEGMGGEASYAPGGTATDHDSTAYHSGVWGLAMPLLLLRYRLWPMLVNFFCTKFFDEKSESHYKKENWFMKKSLAVWSSVFLIVNWVLGVAFVPRPLVLADKLFYYCISPLFTFPIFFMVIYNWPRDRPKTYQIFLLCSVWIWSFYSILFMFLCGFYRPEHSHFTCGKKDFIGTFYYTTALPTIALFGLKLHRFPAAIGAVAYFAFTSPMVLPYKTTWYRNLLNFLVYQAFLLYVHYMRENAERRLYTLRDQLKIQFRATQKAQVNERKAADSKRRLTSYVFHEVRVPLNTALLAVQNMAAEGTFARAQDIEFRALEGSLSMMSKVLNDVLDFNRMDSGRFESVSRPYAFHQVMRSMFVPLRLATDSRNLKFITELDPNIDIVSRRAAYISMGEDAEGAARRISEHPDDPGMVVGDEMRLRQIITNLASNACKFTPAGGTVTMSTKLLWPVVPPKIAEAEEASETLAASVGTDGAKTSPRPEQEGDGPRRSMGDPEKGYGLSARMLDKHNESMEHQRPPLEKIIVRIEVTDTGCGIQNKEMVHNKLFSAFNQTEMGRTQGGKGTGLGLALVRQIVKRSGGRLGVRSKVCEGSTFWVELPLGVGAKAIPAVSHVSGSPLATASDLDILGDATPAQRPRIRNDLSSSSTMPTEGETPPTQSAMHGIMDQGGLVELFMANDASNTSIPTRTIGDPSTGTQPLPNPETPIGEFAPAPQGAGHRPSLHEESSSKTVVRTLGTRPTSIDLPNTAFLASGSRLSPVVSPALSARANPLDAPPARPTPSRTATPPAPPPMPVLVVDDDPLTRMLMKRMLTRLGCVVSTAENGQLALEQLLVPGAPTPGSEDAPGLGAVGRADVGPGAWAADCRFAVVFLDNQMPVMSGIQAVAKLREAGRKDFVVGVTGNALLSDQEEYLDAGVDHVLTKPVLERSLKSMLAIAHTRRAAKPPQ